MQKADKFEHMDVAEAMIHKQIVDANFFNGAMQDFDKPAGKPCPYQRHGKGCKVYDKRPFGCRIWNCRWLADPDTAALARPDRSHYVIDIAPDFITSEHPDTGEVALPVMQVWVDPNYRDAHKDTAFRTFLKKEIDGGTIMGALIRWNSQEDSMFLFYANEQWYERTSDSMEMRSHTALEKLAAIGPYKLTFTD